MVSAEETQPQNAIGRDALTTWQNSIKQNLYQNDPDFQHSVKRYLLEKCPEIEKELTDFAHKIIHELEPLVIENNLSINLPRIEYYDGIGHQIETVVHHPTYEAAGNLIYSSRLLERMTKPGGLLESLTFMFLSSQTGEAGHNCPVACSAGIIRVLQKTEDFPNKKFYINKLIEPSYTTNFTGAQFLTEIQGGSDVGLNATEAYQDQRGHWRIKGEKWFCSNADAELILLTARFDKNMAGTKGLGLFLVPAKLSYGKRNHYTMRRLKDKIGTRSMASAEIDFHDAFAFAVGEPAQGFKMVMENVLHISRLFNTFCVLGMARRAYFIALAYAKKRVAFGHPIIEYPLVKENLAQIKVENTALLASIFATVQLQDDFDMALTSDEKNKLLLRLLANLNKYLSALWSVDHIHHALDVLAGNGAIESFSIIPRLLRDCIVCENWEGTHNTLRMQILKDILRYKVDEIFLVYLNEILGKISSANPHVSSLKIAIEQLKTDLMFLKSTSQDLQSLQIKNIVDRMSILYCSIHLLIEALDQSKNGNMSKMLCLEYFTLLHIQKDRMKLDEHYLELINKITSSDAALSDGCVGL